MKPVWVVDDNAAVASGVAALLQSEGYPAVAIFGGKDARAELLKGHVPSVIVLDILMPGNGGNRVLEALMLNPEWTFPVVVMTGDESAIRADVRGRVFRVVAKPFDPLELVAEVRRALGEKS